MSGVTGNEEQVPGEVEIAEMRYEDVDQVVEIERRSFPTPWSRQAFLSELRDNAYALYLVARLDGRVIGYAGMWVLLDEAHITNIAVHPDYRQRGIASRLLRELERRAVRRGARRMTLEVRPSNAIALRLYAKHGFRTCGRRPRYYADTDEDAIIMWKEELEPEKPDFRGLSG